MRNSLPPDALDRGQSVVATPTSNTVDARPASRVNSNSTAIRSQVSGRQSFFWQLHLIRVLCTNEVRLRTRRLSTLFAVMAMIVVSWAMIVDPKTGSSLISINNARVLYTSSALAMGSASLLSFLLALIGFYLVRGRIVEDIRSGIGSVIAATPVGNGLFLFSRWLGGVAYMLLLIMAAMCSIMVLQVLRGDGPIQFGVYLQTYLLVLGPMIFFAVGAAILFDSTPFLMGKAGDLIYFIAWVFQISLISKIEQLSGGISSWLFLDFSGLVTTVFAFKTHLMTTNFSLGASTFDPTIAPIILPVSMWTSDMVMMRFGSAALALCVLLPAIPLFHRFSPDKVKASHSRKRRSPLEVMNTWSRPLAKQVQPLFLWSAKSSGLFGQTTAEVALSLVSAPFSIFVLVLLISLSALINLASLPGLGVFAVVFWGVMISDISTRDYQSAMEHLTGAGQGGANWRYVRQLMASLALGFLFVGVIIFRLSFTAPLLALALSVGIVSMSAAATFLGKTSNTSKTFMSLYLFTVYLTTQATKAPMLDIFGFNGVANLSSIALQVEIAVFAGVAGFFYSRWKAS
jgi:hypothetical protein